MKKIFLKRTSEKDILKELNNIGFDGIYSKVAQNKYRFSLFKIFNLRAVEANILKQTALSVGCDCAVHHDVITSTIEYSDCILGATNTQLKQIIQKLKLQPFKMKELSSLLEKELNYNENSLILKHKTFDLSSDKMIMGILNITHNSFSDGGKFCTIEKAISHVNKMLVDGADIIDVGAESTKPNAPEILPEYELNKLLPILNELRTNFPDCIISVDTRNASTAKKLIDKNLVDIINDISGFEHDRNMFEIIIKSQYPYILTDYGREKQYGDNIVDEVYKNLYNKINQFSEKGYNTENLILDPGIGFGKSIEQNYKLISRINEFKSLKLPILVGHSRKSFMLNKAPKDKDPHTAALSLYLLLHGAAILRVHNVKLTKEILEMGKSLTE